MELFYSILLVLLVSGVSGVGGMMIGYLISQWVKTKRYRDQLEEWKNESIKSTETYTKKILEIAKSDVKNLYEVYRQLYKNLFNVMKTADDWYHDPSKEEELRKALAEWHDTAVADEFHNIVPNTLADNGSDPTALN